MENDVQKKPETSKRKKLLPLLLIVALLVVGGIVAGVTLLAGPSRKTEVEVGDFETLKEVVEATESERIITLTSDIQMTESITLPGNVKITITDDGTPRTLTRQDMDTWMFWVPEDSTLELKGTAAKSLVLDGNSGNVKCGPDGAMLIGEYAEFVLENVVLKDNRTNSGMGGLMRVVTCDVTATNSSFTGGTSKSGGAVYAIESSLAFTNCDISDNRSTQGHGGALYVDNASTLSLMSCTMNNNYINTGSGYGGAFIITNFSQADVVDTTFDGNYVDHDGVANGGAMYVAWGSVANLSGKTVISNSYAKGGGDSNALGGAVYINEGSAMNIGEGVLFSGNSGTHGGAIYAIDTASVTVDGAVFTDNHTTKGNGGAIYCWRDPTLSVKNTTFLKNYTQSQGNAYGGAVALATGAVKATFENCTFEANYTDNAGYCNGGALLVGEGSTVTMTGNNVFKDNWGKSTGGQNTCGGAIYVSKASLTMGVGTTFTGNYGSHGGAVYVNYNGNFIVEGAKFDGNYTYKGHGGAICAWNGGNVEAANCTFTNNYLDSDLGAYGGAVAVYNKDVVEYVSTGTFSGCTFDGNKTVRSSGEANANGGAMYIGMGAIVSVNGGSVFSNNYVKVAAEKANCYGGAIYLNTNSVLNLGSSTFTNNSAEVGGAVMANGSAKMNVSGATFVGNAATVEHGGAIYTTKTPTVISGSTFTKNNSVRHGGAVMIVGVEEGTNASSGTITNCTFTGNYSKTQRGGAVASFYSKNLAISGSTFTENYTNYAHGGAVFTQNMPVEIKGSTFTKNYVSSTAGGYGGAVAIVNTEVTVGKSVGTITDCVFDGNYTVRTSGDAAANGGAVYAGLGTKLTVNGKTEFKNNYAKAYNTAKAYYGGAIYANTDCEVTIGDEVSAAAEGEAAKGVTFTGNTGRMGGAVAVVGAAKLNVIGATFDGNYTNYAHGGAIYAETTDAVLKNSTFTGNKIESVAGGYGGAVATDGKKAETGKTLTIDGCVFEGNSTVRPEDATANANGGALYIGLYTKADITNTAFNGNIASSGKGTHNGGAIYTNTGCVVNLGEGVSFNGNIADNGGAIGAVDAAALNISGVTMVGNEAETSAAAVYFSAKVPVTINGVSITGAADAKTTDIVIPAGKTLDVAGTVALGTVTYADEASMIKLTGAVEGTATLIPAKYEEGFQIVTADDAALLAGIGAKFAVAKSGEIPWELNDEGKLMNMQPTVMIGETGYLTLDEALKAAKTGDELKLVADTKVKADAEIPADITITTDGKTITVADGKTLTVNGAALKGATVIGNVTAKDGADLSGAIITGSVTAGDGAKLNGAKITGDVAAANVDATDAAVTGKITVAAGKVLTVGGAFTADEVYLETGATVNVATALTADDKAFTLKSAVETIDTLLVTAPDAAAITAAVAKINPAFEDNKVGLDETTGKIKSDVYVAMINGVGYESMAAAAAAAVDGDTIVVRKSHTVSDRIDIDKNVIIDGNGNILTRAETLTERCMIYVKAGGALEMDDIVIDGANVAAEEGAMVTNGTLTLGGNVVIKNAKTSSSGGAVCMNAGTMTVAAGAKFENNTAAKHGGAIYVLKGNLTVGAVTFTGNTAGGNGGAIEVVNPVNADPAAAQPTLTVDGATFTENKALNTYDDPAIVDDPATSDVNEDDAGTYGKGGAISADTKGAVTLTNVTASKNVATGNHGGVIWSQADLTVTGGTYEENSAAQGGAVYNKATANITDAVFHKNTADAAGGAVATDDVAGVVTTITGATFTNNSATDNGGAVFNHKYGTMTLTNVTADNNSAKNGGVVRSNGETSLTITGGSYTGNSATYGGVVYSEGAAVIGSGTFTGNSAATSGGVIFYGAGTVTVNGGTFENNTANDAGGVSFGTKNKASVMTVNGGTFTGNNAKNRGGVFYNHAGNTLNVNGGTYTGNYAAKAITTGAYGGGVIWNNYDSDSGNKGTVVITGGTFDGNGALSGQWHGGVIYTGGNVTIGTENLADATKIQFLNNKTGANGGVIYATSTASVTIHNGTFSGNQAKTNGGVIWNDCDAEIYNGVFTNNSANTGGVVFIDGGASAENNNVLTIHNGTFSANKSTSTSDNTGGGVARIREYTTLNIYGGVFGGDTAAEGNTSAADGGVIWKDGGNNNAATINIIKTGTAPLKFANNRQTKSGRMGGVFASKSAALVNLNIDGAEFVNNSAVGNGGVFYLHSGVTATIENSTFSGNTANHGAALFVGVSSKTVTVEGCIFENNTVTTTGGAIRINNGTLNIDATTVFSTAKPNKAAGVANDIYKNGGTLNCQAAAIVTP